MYSNKNKSNYLGLIRFSDMIPISDNYLIPIDVKSKTNKYVILLNNQFNYINIPENKETILRNAKSLYDIVERESLKNGKSTKQGRFYKNISCNFSLLEERCIEYTRVQEALQNLQHIDNEEDLFYIYDNLNDKDQFENVILYLDNIDLKPNIQDMSKEEINAIVRKFIIITYNKNEIYLLLLIMIKKIVMK